MASNNDSSPPVSTEDARADLTAQIDDLLNTLSNKFAGVSSEIFAKMDEMSRRLDNIEASIKSKEDASKS
ncbi:heat shock factor-binding protein [Grosmannia clavigera kw1407]|uniref:Heat shock factor-binding protein n=1 Tax=Grosmannia clavigera (strain kw1407 / UAMH 11150) TaxID=655863 RepID=F0XM40_GROCL|nr:heat shock factor-binding protein [Grosmannia clavigera kw1407]EFX01490.1 heat shock factor-binding protein [Grosmannia clavigera kw1407]